MSSLDAPELWENLLTDTPLKTLKVIHSHQGTSQIVHHEQDALYSFQPHKLAKFQPELRLFSTHILSLFLLICFVHTLIYPLVLPFYQTHSSNTLSDLRCTVVVLYIHIHHTLALKIQQHKVFPFHTYLYQNKIYNLMCRLIRTSIVSLLP